MVLSVNVAVLGLQRAVFQSLSSLLILGHRNAAAIVMSTIADLALPRESRAYRPSKLRYATKDDIPQEAPT